MRFYRYGFRETTLDDVRGKVEACGVVLQQRSSDFLGGTYYLKKGDDEASTKVYCNRDQAHGGFLRPSLAEYDVLVDIVDFAPRDVVLDRFGGMGGVLLDEEELPDDDDDEDDD